MMLLLAAAAEIASLTSPRDSYPNASRDGRLIVFQTTRSGKQALWVANADGSNPRHLFDGGKVGTDPSTPVWSPDGRSIAFAMRPTGQPMRTSPRFTRCGLMVPKFAG